MNSFDIFVLPFAIGLYTLVIIFFAKAFDWIKHLPVEDRRKLSKGIRSRKVFGAIKEIFMESLLHRRIFKVNPLLGYMHMSLAFGWFLLIVFGTIESKIYGRDLLNAPWDPIFFKYFKHDTTEIHSAFFNFTMDVLLLFVLSGVVLAYSKRLYSRLFGMKKTTKQIFFDKLAIISLWLIFPLRLFAESFTSGIHHNGGFLTDGLGSFLGGFLPIGHLEYTTWWLYSLSVGAFFIAVPYSRYMHIPTEILLISLRRFGIKTETSFTNFSQIEVYSCSRCGICIDKCQLSTALNKEKSTSVYFLNSIRGQKVKENLSFDCMICGRCQEFCPVQINLMDQRLVQRNKMISNGYNFQFLSNGNPEKAKVAYYAGCMTHLTPSIKKAMIKILDNSQTDYIFIDEDGGACCGRPMMTTGNFEAASKLIDHNKNMILKSEAEILVTSCAICYRIFKDNYNLPVKVMHHSEFILDLVKKGEISLDKSTLRAVYHDPCELGRGSGIYEEPRELLGHAVDLVTTAYDKENALCCGGSLGNIMLGYEEKNKINAAVWKEMMINEPEILVTACPLCKKTFNKNAPVPVKDIAEIVADALQTQAEAIIMPSGKKAEIVLS
jgi:Fe-S oxidoreductase